MRNILTSFAVIVIILLTSCHKTELTDGQFPSDDAGLIIKLSPSENSSITRATQNATEEEKINNAYVFIFNSDGGMVYSEYKAFSPQFDKTMTVKKEDVPSGSGMTIAVVANINNQIMDASESTFSGVASLADLESLSTLMLGIEHPLQRGSSFLMSGKETGIALSADMPKSVDVPLYRTDAKIKFNIEVDNSTYSNIEFTPTEWRVGSYPKRVRIFDTATESEFASNDANYGEYTAWANFEQTDQSITASSSAPATFAFYGLESILSAGTIPPSGTINEQYALREKQVKNADNTNQEKFKYAPTGSTFVEFKGAIKYEASNSIYAADVTYKVQLGGVDDNGNTAVNNFNTYRNTAYTYNVSIKGINDILVEVTEDKEQRPGAEGNIITSSSIKELDAYNSIFTYSFHKDGIDKNLRWEVSTIFSQGGKDDNAKDYKWVHFRLNDKSGNNYNTNFKEYPGDNAASNVALNSDAAVDNLITQISNGTVKLLDVDQLVEVLKRCEARNDKPLFDNNGNITFTVFVKENYYDYDVNTASSGFNKMLWQKFVNADKRVLSIISGYTQSEDKESSRSEAQVSFRQATIQTMYNTKESGEEFSGFGSQFYPKSIPNNPDEETDFSTKTTAGKAIDNIDNVKDKNDGRANCINLIKAGTDRWDNFINIASWTLKSDYDYPLYKFLLYNRDMNGNGIIDGNEIQWYMASINQLTDLWIGEDSFNPNSKLYLYSDGQIYKQHYASSTLVNNVYGGFWDRYKFKNVNVDILWSFEGSSIGTLTDAGRYDRLYYRILRNFGLENSSTASVDKIYTYTAPTASSDGYIELSRLNSKSIRNNITGQLPAHELRDPAGNNKVPRKFAISKTLYGLSNKNGSCEVITSGGDDTWKKINGEETDYSLLELPDNWRIPNQRELSLMYSVLESSDWPLTNHFSRTGFYDEWEDNNNIERPGFAVTNNGEVLTLLTVDANNKSGGVRPVKDVE